MRVFLVLPLLLALSACYAHSPSSVRVDGVGEVRYDDNHRGNGNFCPPGQAKKHNC